MIKLEDIQRNASLEGIEPGQVVRVVATEPAGTDGITIVYRTAEGKIQERMLFRADEPNLSIATANRPWSFEASGEELKLGIEAYRIRLAHLFDPMMAVHTSDVTPLPHQIAELARVIAAPDVASAQSPNAAPPVTTPDFAERARRRKERIQKLEAKLQREIARDSVATRKERNGQLFVWGAMVEGVYRGGNNEEREQLRQWAKRMLTDHRHLKRAESGFTRIEDEAAKNAEASR